MITIYVDRITAIVVVYERGLMGDRAWQSTWEAVTFLTGQIQARHELLWN
jgi:hypothetical protein